MNFLNKIIIIFLLFSIPSMLLSRYYEPQVDKWLSSEQIAIEYPPNDQDNIKPICNYKKFFTETRSYYFGARYYDPKLSRWTAADPPIARGDYLPKPGDFDTDHNYFYYAAHDATAKLKGHGGVFNPINLDAYHYAGQNPVKFVDPDGNAMVEGLNFKVKEAKNSANQIREKYPDNIFMGIVANFIESSPNDFVFGPAVIEGAITKATTKSLATNLQKSGFIKKFGEHAHHIVLKAKNNEFVKKSKQILEKFDIDIHSPINGVFLDPKKHSNLHTNDYMEAVFNSLKKVANGTQEDVVKALQKISKSLKSK